MHSRSNQTITVGDTIMSEHMALHDHAEGDICIRLLESCGRTLGRRRIKESIAAREMRLSLNVNDAIYLSPIYGLVPSKYSPEDDWLNSGDISNNTRMASITRILDEQEHL